MSSIDLSTDVPPHPSAEAILAHPRFAEARTTYVRAILGLYENNPFMNRLLIEAGRSVVFFNILCLYAAYEESDRVTWPTMGLLQETMEIYGISSARRIHDIVARFVETGYVRSVAAPADGRARILTPTEKMLTHYPAAGRPDLLPGPPPRSKRDAKRLAGGSQCISASTSAPHPSKPWWRIDPRL